MSIFNQIKNMYPKHKNSVNTNCSSPTISSELQDLLDQLTQSQHMMGVSSQQLTGVAGSQFYPAHITSTHATVTPPLTDAEKAELKQLSDEREQKGKLLKLEYFKSLPREFRQSVINSLTWVETVNEINNIHAPQTEREQELNTKNYGAFAPLAQSFAQMHTSFQSIFPSQGFSGLSDIDNSISARPASPPLPLNISRGELVQAHMDACLEEELNNEQP